jgi:O-antigen/teichoic acid export membrane protein
MSDGLRRRVVRAVGATSAGSGVAKAVSLLSTLILARLLVPEDFGLMAMATTVTGIVSFFNEIGIGAAIVQRQEVRDEEINGCFGIAVLASSLLCALTVALSWPAAAFFKLQALQPVLAALGFGFFFGALNTVPIALLRRQLRLQAVLWLGLVASIVQALVAIPLAYFGFGYWALVISFFVGQTVNTVWYWRVAGWRPTLPLRLKEGRGLLGYGLNVTYARVMWHVYMNADKLIIGKLIGERAVGVYDMSKSLATLPTSQISGLVTSIASPVFARVQGDRRQLQDVLLRFTRGVAYLTFPALAGIALIADKLVFVLLGAQWSAAALPLQALCVSELVRTVANLQSQLLISTGNVKRLVKYSTACAIALPLAIAVGAWLGALPGVAIAWAAVYPVLAFWLLREAKIVTGLRYADFWHAVRHPVYGTLVMALAVFGARQLLAQTGWPTAVSLACLVGVGAVTYAVYVIFIDREGLAEIGQVLSDFGVPARQLSRWPFNRKLPAAQGGA